MFNTNNNTILNRYQNITAYKSHIFLVFDCYIFNVSVCTAICIISCEVCTILLFDHLSVDRVMLISNRIGIIVLPVNIIFWICLVEIGTSTNLGYLP